MRKKQQNQKISYYILLLFLLLSVMVGSNVLYYRSVRDRITYQTENELRKSNELGMVALQTTIQSQTERLRIIASFCDAPDGSGQENWREMIREFGDNTYRMGAAGLDGVIWYEQDQQKDISESNYFKRAIAGEETVFEVLPGGFDGYDSLVIAEPIREKDGRITGVLCAEYNAVDLGRALNTVEQVENGTTLVFTRDGAMVSSYEGMEQFKDFYEMMDGMDHAEPDAVQKLRNTIRSGGRGFFRYSHNGRERLLYYRPAGIEDWCIVSLVDSVAYQREMGEIRRDSFVVTAIAVFCVISASVLLGLIMRQLQKEMEKGKKDFLTDVYDRKTAKHLFENYMEDGGEGCCFFLDIDYFKEINDSRGHMAGDRALQKTAAILKQEVRREDVVSRYGGDEFCIWLWRLKDEYVARNIAERIVNAFRNEGEFTISMGVAFFSRGDSYEKVIKKADQALYRAKENGRNQFVILPKSDNAK